MRSRSATTSKGRGLRIEFNKKDNAITILAGHKGQLETVIQILKEKMARRSVPVGALKRGKIEDASHDTVRETLTLHTGIETDDAREIVKEIKQLKIKVQAQIMDDKVRVTGKKIDDLQSGDRPSQGARPGIPAPVRQSYLTGRTSPMCRIRSRLRPGTAYRAMVRPPDLIEALDEQAAGRRPVVRIAHTIPRSDEHGILDRTRHVHPVSSRRREPAALGRRDPGKVPSAFDRPARRSLTSLTASLPAGPAASTCSTCRSSWARTSSTTPSTWRFASTPTRFPAHFCAPTLRSRSRPAPVE